MNTTTKARRALQLRKAPAFQPPTDMPDQVQEAVHELLDGIGCMVIDASTLDADGGHAERALRTAYSSCIRVASNMALPDRGALSERHAGLIIDLTHEAEALVRGVEAMHFDDGIGVLASEVCYRLDQVRGLLDRMDFFLDVPEPDQFQAGRDLALALMRDAHRIGGSQDDTPEAWRCYRQGKVQYRFAEQHLAKLVAQPELLDGFSALLSCWLYQCWAGWTDPEQLASIPAAEFEAGVPGQDGTKPDPESVGQGDAG